MIFISTFLLIIGIRFLKLIFCFLFVFYRLKSNMSNNIVIVATYHTESHFVLPSFIKEDDIENYHVKYEILTLYMKDGLIYKVLPYRSASEYEDYNRPIEIELVDDCDWYDCLEDNEILEDFMEKDNNDPCEEEHDTDDD